ncbi:MAG TPA: bifunctional YncE family protein/alkaline phosphatase family protein [Vicinamibacterales bacterium]|nr:bifunctional YncE family protein/alkaline phosphatase family protein [Vicinamibacterales bacterium]
MKTLVAFALVVCSLSVAAFGDRATVDRPGPLGGGVTLLPNGWKIAPAGRHVQVGDLPLAMAESPDGKYLLVSNNGYALPSISIVDVQHQNVRGTLQLDHAWVGLAWHPDGKHVYVSGAANNTVHELTWADGVLTRQPDLVLGRPMEIPRPESESENINRPDPVPQSFVGGIAISPDGTRLFAVHVLGQIVSAVDLKTGHVLHSIELPAEAYTCVVSPDGSTLFVSLWGGAKVLAYDAQTFAPKGEIAVGEHPNAMAITKDGKRLFVAAANTNAVYAIDLAERRAVEQISVAMFPQAPAGSTPNSVNLSPDETRLLVANADNNTVAVVDISKPGTSEVTGFIPTGWYPTAAMFSRDGRNIFVLDGKGLSSEANPRNGPNRFEYIGAMLTGALSVLPTPDRDGLQTLTKMAMSVTAYTDEHRLAPANPPAASPIPKRVGDPSPIKHVFYIIRENRTYDQVFGDLDRGNGDPTLTLFGDEVTPNAHAVVREFGVLDNFYVDAEVSYDGHAWSMGAYATDFVEKLWPTNYARRGAAYLSEGTGQMRNAYGNVAAPRDGYIWDAALRKGLSVRSYGEFTHWEPGPVADRVSGKLKAVASVPGLEGHINPNYPPWELAVPDNKRVDVWSREFAADDAAGRVPALSIIRLGNDHTNGTRAGWPSPRAMVAENDLAVGRVIETISHSKAWNESAIFILEDDAQNGPDHVDAHRSPGLVISPFSKRRTVDSTLYTTSGVLRTMELILGLPPMTQYDAAATPMYNAFQPTPDATPYTHLPARISLEERNDRWTWGADASSRMNLAEADLAPERELNEIIWRSVKGSNSPMPPIRHAGFVRSRAGDGDDDDR